MHHDFEGQAAAGKQCLECTHEKPDIDGWARFKKLMREHYKIPVSDEHMPEFLG